MGNSNQQTSNTNQNQLPESSPTKRRTFFSPLYGKYKHSQKNIVKTYNLQSQHQQQQFLSLLSSYKNITYPSLIPIKNVEMSSHCKEVIVYEVEYQYYGDILTEQIKVRNGGYGEIQLLRFISEVAEGMGIMCQHSFPGGITTTDNIGIYVNQEGKKKYMFSIDPLMHPELYRSGQIYKMDKVKKYIPVELRNRNLSLWSANYNQKMQVYSLAIIVLTMVYSDRLSEEELSKHIVKLRERYSYELSCLIEEMVRKDERTRISLAGVVKRVKEMQEWQSRGEIRIEGSSVFKRGYNSPQNIYIREEEISTAARSKLKQMLAK